ALMELRLDDHVLGQPLRRIAESLLVEREHLERLAVHEVVVRAVVVEVLEIVRLHLGPLDGVGGAEAVLEHVPAAQIPHLHLHERAQVAGRVVMEVDDPARIAVEDDDVSFANLRGGHRHWITLPDTDCGSASALKFRQNRPGGQPRGGSLGAHLRASSHLRMSGQTSARAARPTSMSTWPKSREKPVCLARSCQVRSVEATESRSARQAGGGAHRSAAAAITRSGTSSAAIARL